MTWFTRLSYLATLLAFIVIVLGAFVRLTDAGLGCPDWPGCYGQIKPPETTQEVASAQQSYPELEIDSHKAWHEMIHRYLASALGLLIIGMAFLAWRNRHDLGQPLWLPMLLVLLVCFQGALGMWTVTLLLRPAIVTLHLITGMATLALLCWTALCCRPKHNAPVFAQRGRGIRGWALLGVFILFGQIALGGWTSTNYAALHCPDFPTCQGQWLPATDFAEAFDVIGKPGINYEGGLLDNDARVTIHLMHRIGAVITALYLVVLGIAALRTADPVVHNIGMSMLVMLAAQIALGIANVLLGLPLSIAVAHNGGAALLLLSLITLNHGLRRKTVATI